MSVDQNCTIHAFFISSTFISNTRLKLAENQTKAKQHPEAERLLFEIYLFYSSTFSKIIGHILKDVQKTSDSILKKLYDKL